MPNAQEEVHRRVGEDDANQQPPRHARLATACQEVHHAGNQKRGQDFRTGPQAGPLTNVSWTCRNIHRIAIQCDCPGARQRSAIERGAGVNGDGCLGHDISCECCVGSQGGGTADLPEHVLRQTAAAHDDLAVTGGRGHCGHYLEDPDTTGRASQSEVPGYSQRGLAAGCLVNARGEGQPAYICGEDGPSCCSGGVVISRGQVTLGGHGHRIPHVLDAR